jgi:hypothetical protein
VSDEPNPEAREAAKRGLLERIEGLAPEEAEEMLRRRDQGWNWTEQWSHELDDAGVPFE